MESILPDHGKSVAETDLEPRFLSYHSFPTKPPSMQIVEFGRKNCPTPAASVTHFMWSLSLLLFRPWTKQARSYYALAVPLAWSALPQFLWLASGRKVSPPGSLP